MTWFGQLVLLVHLLYFAWFVLKYDLPHLGNTNLAYGKPTAQSSTQNSGPDKAVDGNHEGHYFYGKTCTHTTVEDNPWWRVDLIIPTLVTQLVIFNRVDCCKDRLNNFTIHVGSSLTNNGNANPSCGGLQSMNKNYVKTIQCPNPVIGRYVNIQLHHSNIALTICEVIVNGIAGK